MKLVKLTKEEFKKFADNHEQITFHQTKEWAKLKENTGWKSYYIGFKNDNTIIAAALLLAKEIPIIRKKMFYSPRGFLIDYNNQEILKKFTKEIKQFIKNEKGIFLKIDPYVEYQERDNNGNVVENGYNNKKAVENLKKLGYKHFGFNIMQDTLQPRWMHVIEINGKSEEEIQKAMESKTRQILRKNEKSAIKTREAKKDELPLFKSIMEHTGDRRDFIDRPLSYYEAMWNTLEPSGILKILIAEIDFNEYETNTKKELDETKEELNTRIYKHDNKILKMNEKKYESANNHNKDTIKRLEKQIEKIHEYKNKFGDRKVLGTILFLIYGNEVLSLFGGTDDNLLQFQSAYTIHYAGIKYAIDHDYKRYNFYGITGNFSEHNPLYGLYLFKKSFGGHVVELIGEYDLVISKFWYILYKITFKIYHKIKKIIS